LIRATLDPSGNTTDTFATDVSAVNLAYSPAFHTDVSFPTNNPDAALNSSLYTSSTNGNTETGKTAISCLSPSLFRVDQPVTSHTYYYRIRIVSDSDLYIYNPQIAIIQIA